MYQGLEAQKGVSGFSPSSALRVREGVNAGSCPTLTSSDASLAECLSFPMFKFLHECLDEVSEGSRPPSLIPWAKSRLLHQGLLATSLSTSGS